MYAVSFDIDTNCLNKHYPQETYHNAYNDIRKFMEGNGFEWQQGSMYFGQPDRITAVTCVTVVQQMAKHFAWFKTCVKDIRMLRIEENNDLMSAVLIVD